MTLFSQAKGRKVVSIANAGTVGQISELIVDGSKSRVVALHLKKTEDKHADTLRWSDIKAFGNDAVTVEAGGKVTEVPNDIEALSDKAHRVLGKLVLSNGGDELGEVQDVEFDAGTGVIDALHLGEAKPTRCRLVGVGPYAVVVELADTDSDS